MQILNTLKNAESFSEASFISRKSGFYINGFIHRENGDYNYQAFQRQTGAVF